MLFYFGGKYNFLASQGLMEWKIRSNIGIKRMGELDTKPFLAATKRKFSSEEADEKGVELCSLWEAYLRDPSWHPFKIIMDKEGNTKVCLYVIKKYSYEHLCKHATCLLQSLVILI